MRKARPKARPKCRSSRKRVSMDKEPSGGFFSHFFMKIYPIVKRIRAWSKGKRILRCRFPFCFFLVQMNPVWRRCPPIERRVVIAKKRRVGQIKGEKIRVNTPGRWGEENSWKVRWKTFWKAVKKRLWNAQRVHTPVRMRRAEMSSVDLGTSPRRRAFWSFRFVGACCFSCSWNPIFSFSSQIIESPGFEKK